MIGYLFLIFVSFIAILFFLFGIMLVFMSSKNLILFYNLNLMQILYLIVGIYIVYNSIKNYIKFYKSNIKKPYNNLINLYKNNKIEIMLTAVISTALFFAYFNGLYLNYNFVIKIILFFPIFLFQNLIFAVKIYSRTTLKPIFLSSSFDLLLPIVEVYYVFMVVKLILRVFYKNKNPKLLK